MRRSRMFAAAMLANLFDSYSPNNCEFDPTNRQDESFFDADMVRALPLVTFWMPVIEHLAHTYGPENWLTRVQPTFRLHGVWINTAEGRNVVFEMTYNEKGNRTLFAVKAETVAQFFARIPAVLKDDLRLDAYLESEDISIWMD